MAAFGCLLTDFGQVKKLLVILLTLINTNILSVILMTLNNTKILSVISLTSNKTVSQGAFGYLLFSTYVTYGVPCHAIGHQVLPTHSLPRVLRIWESVFTLRHFLPCTPSCCFQGFYRTSSSTSKLAGLHADLWNIIPVRLFVWITAIHKRYAGRFYLRARHGQIRMKNLLLTRFELFSR